MTDDPAPIPATVTMTEVKSGEQVSFPTDFPPIYGRYYWISTQGCDCSRIKKFAELKGRPEPDDIECGEGLYHVRIVDADGNLLYDDRDEDPDWGKR